MKYISMKELRENFSVIRDGIKSGESYKLLYRSKPLAEIRPLVATKVDENDQVERDFKKIGETGKGPDIGSKYTPEQLNKMYDEAVYGLKEKLDKVDRLAGALRLNKDYTPDQINKIFEESYE